MYSLLIVDDELLSLETLRDYVDWNALEIGPVYTAQNGKTAYEKIMNKNPDIVITDIHMPVMDGIELAKKLHSEKHNIKIVFLTGYDDYEFVKAAFTVEAVDYILKPFSVEGINEVIEKVKAIIEKDKIVRHSMAALENKLIEKVLREEDDVPLWQAIGQFTKMKNNEKDQMNYGVIQVIGAIDRRICEEIEHLFSEIKYIVYEDNKLTLLILNYVNFHDTAIRLHQYFQSMEIRADIIYSDRNYSIKEMHVTYIEYKTSEKKLFYLKSGTILKADELIMMNKVDSSILDTKKIRQDLLKEFEIAFHEGRFNETEKVMMQYFNELKDRQPEKKYALEEINATLQNLYVTYVKDNEVLQELLPKQTVVWDQLNRAINICDVQLIINTFINIIIEYFEQQQGDKYNNVVYLVKKYIQENYNNVIKAEEIAEKINLSPNYIRNIFKEKTGITILEWVTNYRLAEACTLLKNKSLKIKDISNKVGYENISYFCSIFTKKYGISPNEYRKKY